MKIAIPMAEGKLTMHFGHCQSFIVIETDDKGSILTKKELIPPAHEPGVLPQWLGEELGVNLIIAGGMGQRAQQLFANYGVQVLVGAAPEAPETLISSYFSGDLVNGSNACDH